MKKVFSLIILAVLLSGCSASEGSYQAILIMNEDRFVLEGYDEENEYTMNKQIGTVANTVKPNVMPAGHLWSNYLDKGTTLFSSKEDDAVVLVDYNGQIEVFRKESSHVGK